MYKGYYCRIEYAVSLVKGKWKPTILFRIKSDIKRYNMIYNSINDISHKILVEKIKELEKDELIIKFSNSDNYFEYCLTPKGEEMVEILKRIRELVLKYE